MQEQVKDPIQVRNMIDSSSGPDQRQRTQTKKKKKKGPEDGRRRWWRGHAGCCDRHVGCLLCDHGKSRMGFQYMAVKAANAH
jgi:hypothetical protein